MRRIVRWLVGLVVVGVPTACLAQMYETLTLVDAGYLLVGLDIQNLLRNNPSILSVPPAVVICGMLYMLLKRLQAAHPEPLFNVGMYFVTASMICALFWPEAVGGLFPSGALTRAVDPTEVHSAIAVAEGGTATTAADSPVYAGASPLGFTVATGTRVPVFFHTVLAAVTEVPLRIGQLINAEWQRPHGRRVAFDALLNYKIDNPPTRMAIKDFLNYCYEQAISLYESQTPPPSDPLMWNDVLPWRDPMASLLPNVEWTLKRDARRMHPRYRLAVTSQGAPAVHTVNCSTLYTQTIEGSLVAQLNGELTYRGNPTGPALEADIDMPVDDQAKFLVYREMRRMLPEMVTSKNRDILLRRAAVMAGGKAAASAGQAAVGACTADGGTFAKGVMGFFGGLAGAITGGRAMGVDAIVDFMKPAIALLLFMPYITGMLSATVLGMFPIVVIWSLFPGQHFKPLVNYFLVLLFTQSAPMWYAVSDLLAETAFNQFGGTPSGNFWDSIGVFEWIEAQAAGMVVAVLSTFLVPAAQAILMFGTWRAVAGAFRGV